MRKAFETFDHSFLFSKVLFSNFHSQTFTLKLTFVIALNKKYPNTDISLVRIKENTDKKISVLGNFLRSGNLL